MATLQNSDYGRAKSLDVRRSKLTFWGSISTRLREYNSILCSSLCSNDLSSQTPHKSSPLRENFNITFKSTFGHKRFVLMIVPRFAKSRDVTSLLKLVDSTIQGFSLASPLWYMNQCTIIYKYSKRTRQL